ncbi:hypothetical protein IEE91_04580 [Kocuria sp. cx-455]|uniref:hypothetical protein n=1 Tax=unclassified Candidatus Sulfotelmatobacter TaxID=2635724 RepID=UPI0016841E2E|nr:MULTISPECIES: hypothetical protein [unclassified Candidatus Sulfotelmatobacter]MBD2762492.1 hypothetical protein [Kocuria sp. cx-116]MBD2764479.1 hypothetical protein [Kocuria sp. cx-455]
MTKRVSLRGMLLRHTPLIIVEAVFVVSFLGDRSRGDAENAFLAMGLFQVSLTPLVVEAIGRIRIPMYLQLLYAILLFTGGYMGSYRRFYDVWEPWDTVVHFYSGIMIAVWADYILRSVERKHGFVLPRWLRATVITSVSALVAMLWEVGEFAADQTTGSRAQINNYDTMVDMITGTLSALIVAVILAWRAPRRRPAEGELTHSSTR